MQIRSKLPDVGTTIFTVMSRLAEEHGAYNLSQGFPDFEVPAELVARVEHYMHGGCNQYAPMQGAAALRERIARKVADLYGATVDPETGVTVTAGATEALFAAVTSVVHPGDRVVLFEPAYDSYVPAIRLSGGCPVFLRLKYPGYRIDWDQVRDAVAADTRLIIVNSPHNPTGSVLSADDLAALRAIVADTDVLILSDEVYEHIVFDNAPHQSMLRDPLLAEHSFVVSSFGKTYHATGWKIGYCIAPPHLTAEFRRIHQFVTFCANTPIQLALADFMADPNPYLKLSSFYQSKRDAFLSLMAGSRFQPLPCGGTYFQLLGYSAISDMPDTDFARHLTVNHKVAAIPPSVFYHRGDDHRVLRFCFAKKDETLQKAAEILCGI
jgi:methionine aminotransferase